MIGDLSLLLIAVVVIALIFDYTNGFHDAANAIATATANKPRSVSFASELWWPAADRRRPAHRW